MVYDPQVNDYVRWTTALGMVHEGWVYYKGDTHDNQRRLKDNWLPLSNSLRLKLQLNLDHNVMCLLSCIKGYMYVCVVMKIIGMNWNISERG